MGSSDHTNKNGRPVPFREMSDEQLRAIQNTLVLWMFLGGLLVVVGLLLPSSYFLIVVFRYVLILLGFFIAIPPVFQLNGVEQELARRGISQDDSMTNERRPSRE